MKFAGGHNSVDPTLRISPAYLIRCGMDKVIRRQVKTTCCGDANKSRTHLMVPVGSGVHGGAVTSDCCQNNTC